jgi:hypothetical protein
MIYAESDDIYQQLNQTRGRRSRDRMGVGLLPMQSVPITTNVVSSNPTQAIQHYKIKFVSDLRQVGGFVVYSGFLHQ